MTENSIPNWQCDRKINRQCSYFRKTNTRYIVMNFTPIIIGKIISMYNFHLNEIDQSRVPSTSGNVTRTTQLQRAWAVLEFQAFQQLRHILNQEIFSRCWPRYGTVSYDIVGNLSTNSLFQKFIRISHFLHWNEHVNFLYTVKEMWKFL